MSRNFNCIHLIILFLASHAGYSQEFQSPKYLNTDNGLSNRSVTAIAQDGMGFIWIGTKKGLNKYDGYSFKQMNGNLGLLDISQIISDKAGNLWIGTAGSGLLHFDIQTNTFSRFLHDENESSTIPSNLVTSLFLDSEETLWIGTENGLVIQKKDSNLGEFQHINSDFPLDQVHIRCITEDLQGNIWIGTFGSGLIKVNNHSLHAQKEFPENHLLNSNFIISIFVLGADELLLGTRNNDLIQYNIASRSISKYGHVSTMDSSSNQIVRAILSDTQSRLWIGTDGNGAEVIINYKNHSPKTLHLTSDQEYPAELSGNSINEIFEDKSGNIWLGTAWNGLTVISKASSQVQQFQAVAPSDKNIPVLSIYEDSDVLWLGTDGHGITKVSKKTQAQRQEDILSNNYIQLISKRKNGMFWIGTFADGLFLYDSKKGVLESYKHEINNPSSLSFNDVRGVVELNDDSVMVGTWGGGLNLVNRKTGHVKIIRALEKDSLGISNDNITCIEKDNKDNIWISTFGGGLNLYHPSSQTFTQFHSDPQLDNSLSSENILTLHDDQNGFLWIGTWDAGIDRMDLATHKIERFQDVEFLQNRTVTAIEHDLNGNIWFSTKKGVLNYDIQSETFHSYPELKGEYHINSVSKNNSGHIYFGGINGAIKFDPISIKKQNLQDEKNVIFTDFKLYNISVPVKEDGLLKQHISNTDEINLTHDQNDLTFEFTSLEYPTAQGYEFAVKLEGFENEWRINGNQRTINFTNLPPGEYVLKVRNRIYGGEWNTNQAMIQINISKPYWHTWWAYLTYTLLFLVFLYAFRKYTIAWEKMRSQLSIKEAINIKDKELHQVKQRFFNNISHEIRTPVTLILGAINRLKEEITPSSNTTQQITSLSKNSQYLLKLVNELLEFRKLEAGQVSLKASQVNISEFVKEIYLSFTTQASSKNIELNFETSCSDQSLWIDNIQMEKVIFNLLDNAFKYCNEHGSIRIGIMADDQFCYVKVQNSGNAIPSAQLEYIFKRFYQSDNHESTNTQGFGIGLSIVSDIVKLHHGAITVESDDANGTQFIIKLPIGNFHFTDTEILPSGQSLRESSSEENQIQNEELPTLELEEFTTLIVEDNKELRKYIGDVLSSEYKIIEASNGEEGFQLAKETIPDLIISDVMMPIKDGIELVSDLKKEQTTSHIPIILLTARTGNIYKKEGFDIGADDYITKPFNEQLLKSRIRNLILSRQKLWKRFSIDKITEPKKLDLQSVDQQFLQELIDLVEESITANNDMTPDFLSKELGMSHSVIYKKLKHLTGQSIVEFIRDFKLKRGAELIGKYQYTVQEACYKSGFSDRRYFTRAFKKKFGVTPSQYAQKD